jgi:hypothetical protein
VTRQEIEAAYKVENGIVKSLGKFQGQPTWVVYLWDLFLNGFGDGWAEDHNEVVHAIFEIDASDVEVWPELEGVYKVDLWEDALGFMHKTTIRREEGMTDSEWNAANPKASEDP